VHEYVKWPDNDQIRSAARSVKYPPHNQSIPYSDIPILGLGILTAGCNIEDRTSAGDTSAADMMSAWSPALTTPEAAFSQSPSLPDRAELRTQIVSSTFANGIGSAPIANRPGKPNLVISCCDNVYVQISESFDLPIPMPQTTS
jgi:hypothetical protein